MTWALRVDSADMANHIPDELGGAFGTGAIGGGAYHFLKGLKNSPSGSRMPDAFQIARMKAPNAAGGFAIWGAIVSFTDCSLVYLQQKDTWNSIMAGVFTGSFLQIRQGVRLASRGALMSGMLLALVEGYVILFNRFQSPPQQQIIYVDSNDLPIGPSGIMHMPNDNRVPQESASAASPTSSSSTASWVRRWFGEGGKKEEEKRSGGKTEVLVSNDAPTPPTFESK